MGVLDDTTCALFVDLRNSGRQDLVVLRGRGRCSCFATRERDGLPNQPDAFRFGTFRRAASPAWRPLITIATASRFVPMLLRVFPERGPVPLSGALSRCPERASQFPLRDHSDGRAGTSKMSPRQRARPQQQSLQLRPGLVRCGWRRLARPVCRERFRPKNLYRNRGGKFRDEAAEAGVENIGPGMSAAWFDYDRDGRPDLYVSNMWTAPGQRVTRDPPFTRRQTSEPLSRHTKGNSLYRNRGDGTFEARSREQGVAMGRWALGRRTRSISTMTALPRFTSLAGMLTNNPRRT